MLWDVQDFLMLRRWGLRSREPAPGLAHSQQGPESTLGFPSEWVGRCSADGRGGKPPSCVYRVMSMSVLLLVLRFRLPPGTGDGKPAAGREGQADGGSGAEDGRTLARCTCLALGLHGGPTGAAAAHPPLTWLGALPRHHCLFTFLFAL